MTFVVFILSNDFEVHAWLVTPLNFEPIASAIIWKIHYSYLCIRFAHDKSAVWISRLFNVAESAEFNVVCRSKSYLPERTDSNAALLQYLTHQLGSVHEWSGIWNGPNFVQINFRTIVKTIWLRITYI